MGSPMHFIKEEHNMLTPEVQPATMSDNVNYGQLPEEFIPELDIGEPLMPVPFALHMFGNESGPNSGSGSGSDTLGLSQAINQLVIHEDHIMADDAPPGSAEHHAMIPANAPNNAGRAVRHHPAPGDIAARMDLLRELWFGEDGADDASSVGVSVFNILGNFAGVFDEAIDDTDMTVFGSSNGEDNGSDMDWASTASTLVGSESEGEPDVFGPAFEPVFGPVFDADFEENHFAQPAPAFEYPSPPPRYPMFFTFEDYVHQNNVEDDNNVENDNDNNNVYNYSQFPNIDNNFATAEETGFDVFYANVGINPWFSEDSLYDAYGASSSGFTWEDIFFGVIDPSLQAPKSMKRRYSSTSFNEDLDFEAVRAASKLKFE